MSRFYHHRWLSYIRMCQTPKTRRTCRILNYYHYFVAFAFHNKVKYSVEQTTWLGLNYTALTRIDVLEKTTQPGIDYTAWSRPYSLVQALLLA